MAGFKENHDVHYIGQYLWDKVGSRSSFKNSKLPRRNTSTVVTSPSRGGLAQDVVGIFATVGNMAFFVDIETLMGLRKYSFGDGVPNKVHMSMPLHVPALIKHELLKRQQENGCNDDENSDCSMDSDCDDMHTDDGYVDPPVKQPLQQPKMSPDVTIHGVMADCVKTRNIDTYPPTRVPQKTDDKPTFAPQNPPGVAVEMAFGETSVKHVKCEGRKPRKPRAPRVKKATRTPTPLEVLNFEETIDQVVSGMIPTNDPLVQAAADAGITIPMPSYSSNIAATAVSAFPNIV